MKFLTLSFIFLSLVFSVNAQKKRAIVDFELFVDSTDNFYHDNSIKLGIKAVNGKGAVKKTQMLFGGNYRWHRYNVSVRNGSFSNGVLKFSLADLYKGNGRIDLEITPKNNPSLTVPFILRVSPIKTISLHYNNSKEYKQGEAIFFSVHALLEDGTVLRTGALNRSEKISKKLFTLNVNGEKQSFLNCKVPFLFEKVSKSVDVTASLSLNKSVTDSVTVPISLTVNKVINLSAPHGTDGRDGAVFNNGSDGTSGNNALPCSVYVDGTVVGNDTLVRCFVTNGKHTEKFIYDPFSSTVSIIANGGNGGNGGDGDSGSNGSDETEEHGATDGEPGGDGGNGGHGGNGGDVIFFADSIGDRFMDDIGVTAAGGFAGKAGIGGKGGLNGQTEDEKPKTLLGSMFDILLPSRARNGSDGMDGLDGVAGELYYDGPVSVQEMIKFIDELVD